MAAQAACVVIDLSSGVLLKVGLVGVAKSLIFFSSEIFGSVFCISLEVGAEVVGLVEDVDLGCKPRHPRVREGENVARLVRVHFVDVASEEVHVVAGFEITTTLVLKALLFGRANCFLGECCGGSQRTKNDSFHC